MFQGSRYSVVAEILQTSTHVDTDKVRLLSIVQFTGHTNYLSAHRVVCHCRTVLMTV